MLSDNINAGLAELMTNQSAFAAFASSGAFTGETKLSIPDDVASLTTALQLFLTSKTLTASKKFAIIRDYGLLDSVVDGGGGHSGVYQYDDTCDNSYDGVTACYKSATLGYTWYLAGSAGWDITHGIVKNGWANLADLFQGAYYCAQQGHMGKSLVNFNPDGSLDMSCMSQLDECYTSPFSGQRGNIRSR